MRAYAVLPALLVALAVFAWCIRRAKLPEPLEVIKKLGGYGISREELRVMGKRLEALNFPLSPELAAAGGRAVTLLLALGGLFLVLDRNALGAAFLLFTPVVSKSPHLLIAFLEKKRKEELIRDFPLMVDQVKIYAGAAGYYNALKIVSRSFRGPMGRELAVLSAEMELAGLIEAVNNFAARCGIPEIADFARIIVVEETTGAQISHILVNYSNMARQRQVSTIRRKIKIQPILMSVMPGTLLIIFMMMVIFPLVTGIIDQINSIR